MNDEQQRDEFADRMRMVGRRDLPGGWKTGIMTAAFPEDGKVVDWWRPPRWLGAGLAACWVAIAVLRLGAPVDEATVAGGAAEMNPEPVDFALRERLLAAIELDLER